MRVLLYHNEELFFKLYQQCCSKRQAVRMLAAYSRLPLLIMDRLELRDNLVVTNDWTAGLVAAYAKHSQLGDSLRGVGCGQQDSVFFHIAHNLDRDYEGRIYLGFFESHYPEVHGLPYSLLVNDQWHERILNPSRCAFLCSDQWGTVSKTYRADILQLSPLSDLLQRFPRPFGYSNGVDKFGLRRDIEALFGGCDFETHLRAKETLQQTYFGLEQLDDSVLLLSTIGRIVDQKQVHLLLEAVPDLIAKLDGKVQVMVAGSTNPGDPYGQLCAEKIRDLRARFPQHFWADPSYFFSEHRLHLFHGSDFGLMFSRFEPGGLVHLEYLSGGTPMIATRTGGLKDTIEELDSLEGSGSGLFIESNHASALTTAVLSARRVFDDRKAYRAIRAQCFDHAIDTSRGAVEYLAEFFRLKDRVFTNRWEERSFEQAGPAKTVSLESPHQDVKRVVLKGSFDGWVHTYKLDRVPHSNRWQLQLALPAGRHQVVFVLNGDTPYLDMKLPVVLTEQLFTANVIEL